MWLTHHFKRDSLSDSTLVAAVISICETLTTKEHNSQKQHHEQKQYRECHPNVIWVKQVIWKKGQSHLKINKPTTWSTIGLGILLLIKQDSLSGPVFSSLFCMWVGAKVHWSCFSGKYRAWNWVCFAGRIYLFIYFYFFIFFIFLYLMILFYFIFFNLILFLDFT